MKEHLFVGSNYKYTFLDRMHRVYNVSKFFGYNPLDFKIYKTDIYGFELKNGKTVKSTPYTRLKLFLRSIITAYKYTPEVTKYWEANKTRLSCQEKQLRAIDTIGQISNISLIQPEEATCVLWHEDPSYKALDDILKISSTDPETIQIKARW